MTKKQKRKHFLVACLEFGLSYIGNLDYICFLSFKLTQIESFQATVLQKISSGDPFIDLSGKWVLFCAVWGAVWYLALCDSDALRRYVWARQAEAHLYAGGV